MKTLVSALFLASTMAAAQTGPAWANSASWRTVKPIETDNIVYRTVPHIANPSAEASPNPGVPNGIRAQVPNTGPAGTLDMHLDVYQTPSSTPTPVVIQIHGGGWIRGDRPSSYGSFGAFLVAGMSVVTVQYRNAIDAPAPAAIQDVRCAMAWVKANAKKYNFDPERVIPWGGSAGGHLALMAGYAPASFNPPGCTDQPKVVAVLDDYGHTDLTQAINQHGSASSVHQWLGLELPLKPDAAATPGSRPASPRWPTPTDAVLARAREMSPITYVKPGIPPTFIVNGDHDPSVDPSQATELKKALDEAGVPDGHYIVVGGGHGNFSPAEAQKSMLLSVGFLASLGLTR